MNDETLSSEIETLAHSREAVDVVQRGFVNRISQALHFGTIREILSGIMTQFTSLRGTPQEEVAFRQGLIAKATKQAFAGILPPAEDGTGEEFKKAA